MSDLFTLGSEYAATTETSAIFAGTGTATDSNILASSHAHGAGRHDACRIMQSSSCHYCYAGLNGDVVPDAHGGVPVAAQPEAAASRQQANGAGEDSAKDAWGSPLAPESAAASDGDGACEPDQQAAGIAPGSGGGGGHSNRQGRKARAAAFRAAQAPPVPPDGDAQLRGPEPAVAEAGAACNWLFHMCLWQ
jgi:hypothetical protein